MEQWITVERYNGEISIATSICDKLKKISYGIVSYPFKFERLLLITSDPSPQVNTAK